MVVIVMLLAVAIGVSQAVEDCGRTPIKPNLGSRIVNGIDAVPYSWPWQVALCVKGHDDCLLSCGGSIINRQWIITAAHCTPTRKSNYVAKVAVFNIHDANETGVQTLEITEQLRHPDYNKPKAIGHDVALLKLKTPIEYNDHLQPVCLATTDEDLKEGDTMYTTGWGRLSSGGPLPSKLQQVAVPWLSRETCSKLDQPNLFDYTKVCVGAQASNQGSCSDDSGGPLVRQHGADNRWTLYGVTSYGTRSDKCVGKGLAGWYGRVSAFCQWINKTVGETVCRKAV